MPIARTLLLLAITLLSPTLWAETTTLSAKGLTESLKNPDLLLLAGDPKLETARKAVADMLFNQPSAAELEKFHARLANLARHRDTRVGRLFFTALAAVPAIQGVATDAKGASLVCTFELALGSGAQVRVAWVRVGANFLISNFAVEITGNAGALFASAAPYFASGEPDARVLQAAELDYLLGRDTNERTRLESERQPFDFDAALKQRFEIKAGDPAALLQSLADALKPETPAKDRAGLVSRHLATPEDRAALAAQAQDAELWKRIAEQLAVLQTRPIADSAPLRAGATIEISQQEASGSSSGWKVSRLENGELGLSAETMGASDATGK